MCILHLHYLKKITSTVCHTTRRQWGFKWPAESRSIETKLRPDLERVRSRRAIYLSLTHSLSLDSKVIRDQNIFSFSSFVFHLTSKFSRRGHRSVRQKWSQDGAKTFGPPVVRDLEFHQKVYLGNPLDIFCKIILRIFIWCLGYVPCKFYLYRFMAIRM